MPYQAVNGIQLYYEWHGAEDGFPLVLINGLLADLTLWGYQVPAFAAHFRVLLYNCRGQGGSDKPDGSYSAALHAQDLLALLDSLHIDCAHIVGLSNGGVVAAQLLSEHPERAEKLVLASTVGRLDKALEMKLKSWLAALEVGGTAHRFDIALPWIWGATFLESNLDTVLGLREKAASADPMAVRGLIAGALANRDPDSLERITSITAPTLVLVGEEDVLTPLRSARELAAAIPQAQLMVIPEAGHTLPIEVPATFNRLVLQFLRGEG